jgi:NodT family efflux transporter outer membrane factor (OMF) lipoprotein
MRRYLHIGAGKGILLLSGCMVGPKYTKPAAPLAPGFKELTDWKESDGWKVAQPGNTSIRGKWWELYDDPKLNELEEQVDPSNETLKIAEANFRQARAAIRFNRAAEAPTIGTSPSISAVRDSANRPYFPPSLANNGTGDFTLPVDLSYEIDLWGRIRRTVTAAREEAQASAADLETARLSLHAEVAIDYFELRSADAQKKLLDDTVAAYNKALGVTKNRFEGGAAPKSDAAQAQTQLDAARVQASDITVQRAQYEHALAILIGKPPAAFNLSPIPLNSETPTLPSVPVTLPAQLLERRPDIASAERRMAAANEQIGIAQAAYYPTLNLAAVADLEGSSLLNWFNWPSRLWAVGPGLSETLFDAGRRRATTETARAGYDGAVANYRQTVLTSFQQVEDNIVVLRVLHTESAQQHEATGAAEESLRLFQNRYAGGVDTYLQVVTDWPGLLTPGGRSLGVIGRRRLLLTGEPGTAISALPFFGHGSSFLIVTQGDEESMSKAVI